MLTNAKGRKVKLGRQTRKSKSAMSTKPKEQKGQLAVQIHPDINFKRKMEELCKLFQHLSLNNSSSPIHEVSLDLMELICDHLDNDSLINLRSTCRSVFLNTYVFCAKRLFSTIKVYLSPYSLNGLREISLTPSLAQHVRYVAFGLEQCDITQKHVVDNISCIVTALQKFPNLKLLLIGHDIEVDGRQVRHSFGWGRSKQPHPHPLPPNHTVTGIANYSVEDYVYIVRHTVIKVMRELSKGDLHIQVSADKMAWNQELNALPWKTALCNLRALNVKANFDWFSRNTKLVPLEGYNATHLEIRICKDDDGDILMWMYYNDSGGIEALYISSVEGIYDEKRGPRTTALKPYLDKLPLDNIRDIVLKDGHFFPGELSTFLKAHRDTLQRVVLVDILFTGTEERHRVASLRYMLEQLSSMPRLTHLYLSRLRTTYGSPRDLSKGYLVAFWDRPQDINDGMWSLMFLPDYHLCCKEENLGRLYERQGSTTEVHCLDLKRAKEASIEYL